MRDISIKTVMILLVSVVLVGLNGCSGRTDGVPSDTQLVGSIGELPVAVATATPDVINCTEGAETPTLELNGTESFDPDGEIVSYKWYVTENGTDYISLGEGAVLIMNNPCDTVEEYGGVYSVKLFVEDNDGGIASDSVVVTVQPSDSGNGNTLPTANIIAPVDGDIINCVAPAYPSPYSISTQAVVTEPDNTLTLTGEIDPDDDTLTFAWSAWVEDGNGYRESLTGWIDNSDQESASIDITFTEDSFCANVDENCNWDAENNGCPVTIKLDVNDSEGGSDSDQITVYIAFPL